MSMLKDNPLQKSSTVLLIGDSCRDIYVFGTCERLSPEAPVPIFCEVRREERPGMLLNVDKNLRNLGNNVISITNLMTGTKKRLVVESTMHHLIRVDNDVEIKPLKLEQLAKLNWNKIDAVAISDYDKGFVSDEAALMICEMCHDKSIPVFVDSKKRDLSCFPNSTIKINHYEKSLVTKFPDSCRMITTLGAGGAELNDRVFDSYTNTVADQYGMRDVCGAGDTFFAALIHQYLRNSHEIYDAIKFANKCAAVVVGRFGTVAINSDDVT